MTTNTYTSVLDHTSSTGFRAWGSEFGVSMTACGLVQTSDTGQINWTTVNVPAANTAAGYEIWRFSDSSIYLKIEYGTGSGTQLPQMWITVGTGSNGSGTLTGQTSTRNIWTSQLNPTSTTTTYTTYMSATANFFSVCWKANGVNTGTSPAGIMVIGKSVDNTGTPTTTGYGVLRIANGTQYLSFQSVRIAATAATYTDGANFACIPGSPTSSLYLGNNQTYLFWLNLPIMMPFEWACAYITAEGTKLNTMSTALVGTPTHTYLMLGQLSTANLFGISSGSTYALAIVYE